jgi:AraC-like DNA-binding protein
MPSTLIEFGIGFSLVASLLLMLLMLTHAQDLPMPRFARIAGAIMLLGLCHTQWVHLQALHGEGAPWGGRSYGLILVAQSFGFYWLLLGVLRPANAKWPLWEWCAPVLPTLAVLVLPPRFSPVVAMACGIAVTSHIGALLYRVRAQRRHFQIELRALALFGLMALVLLALGCLAPALGWRVFAASYALLITAGFFLVLYVLLRFPDVVRKAEEAVTTAYAVSTLGKVDIERALAALRHAFEQEHLYRDEDLSLSRLAEQLGLSGHQLSELINTQLGTSFPRLVRQYRVEAAKRMLIDEPRASVLSVGLSVGFNSQSSFYNAFKEATGSVPSQFRAGAKGRSSTSGHGAISPS